MSTTAPTPSGPQPAASSRVRVTVRVPVEAERLWTTMWRPEILALWWGEGSRVPLQRRRAAVLEDADGTAWRGWVRYATRPGEHVQQVILDPVRAGRHGFTIRCLPAGPQRSRVRVIVDGVDDPDLVVRFVQERLNRLAELTRGVRARETNPAQALIVIHGIGEQQPGETLKGLVEGLFPPTARPPVIRRVTPDLGDDTFELNRVQIDPESPGYPRTDIYELYWAHLIRDSQLSHILPWAARLLLRWPTRMPPALRGWWYLVWGLTAIAAALVLLGLFAPNWGPMPFLVAVATVGVAVWTTVKTPVLAKIVSFVGDAARYLDPAPDNVARRQAIRAAGVRLVERLHESGRYDRIVILGHSLGSVIAYDIVSIAWKRAHRRNASPHVTSDRALLALQAAVQPSQPVPDPRTMRELQTAAWRELRRNTQPWLVSDLVTAGSPLAHADLLLTTKTEKDIAAYVDDRVLPTDPPRGETIAKTGQRQIGWYLHCRDALTGRRVPMLIGDHAAPFAVTRWTNLHFPANGLKGDPIGGPIPASIGAGVTDVPLRQPPRVGFSHSRYWVPTPIDLRDKADDPDHVDELAGALGLPVRDELIRLNRSLPAHLLGRPDAD